MSRRKRERADPRGVAGRSIPKRNAARRSANVSAAEQTDPSQSSRVRLYKSRVPSVVCIESIRIIVVSFVLQQFFFSFKYTVQIFRLKLTPVLCARVTKF